MKVEAQLDRRTSVMSEKEARVSGKSMKKEEDVERGATIFQVGGLSGDRELCSGSQK